MLLELSNVVWMEDLLKTVWYFGYIMYTILLSLTKGASGDTFTGLSAGSHTINVQFTRAGASSPTGSTLRLSFNITGNN